MLSFYNSYGLKRTTVKKPKTNTRGLIKTSTLRNFMIALESTVTGPPHPTRSEEAAFSRQTAH